MSPLNTAASSIIITSRCRNEAAALSGEGNLSPRDMYVGRTHIIDVLAQQFNVQVSREIPRVGQRDEAYANLSSEKSLR